MRDIWSPIAHSFIQVLVIILAGSALGTDLVTTSDWVELHILRVIRRQSLSTGGVTKSAFDDNDERSYETESHDIFENQGNGIEEVV